MSDEDDKGMSGSDIARKVWLAGLGAYGKAINTSSGAAMKIGAEANKVFEDLVSKGERLEDTAEDVVKNTRQGARQARESVEDRIQNLKSQFGLTRESGDNRMDVMEERMERLESKIDRLLEALDDKPKKKRTSTKKKSS